MAHPCTTRLPQAPTKAPSYTYPCTQDLAEYSKFREKAAASAARSLVSLFRDIAPGMLEKKDRGRGADLGAVPLAYGQAR